MTATVVERYGSLSATGVAKESSTAYGTLVAPTFFVPMTGNNLEVDPGLFSPKVMFGQRDINTFPLYGQYKVAGGLQAPLFPTQGMALLAGAIGQDAAVGAGVTGTGSTSATTLNGGVSAGATTAVLTSASGYAQNDIVQIDVNGASTTSEVRKVTNVATNTITLDAALTYSHLTGAAVKKVTAPYTHTISQANTLPSFTVEKNVGNYQSLVFTGSRVNKYGLTVSATNTEAAFSADLIAQAAAVQATPTAISITDEAPWVFAETVVSIGGTTVAQASSAEISIENGLKETFTMNSAHTLQFLTPVTLKVSGKVDLVFTSFNDTDWGYWTKMISGSDQALQIAMTHPTNAGSVTLAMPKTRIRTTGDAVKFEDIVTTTINFDAFLQLSTLKTITATVVNSQYLPY